MSQFQDDCIARLNEQVKQDRIIIKVWEFPVYSGYMGTHVPGSVVRMSLAEKRRTKMQSYYESKIESMRALGAEVQELGSEIAIIRGEFVAVGGDAPTMYELSGVTPEVALRLAQMGRTIGEEAEYEAYLEESGAREVTW